MYLSRSYRSFVSYLDKSRDYYAAQGYRVPYKWAYHQEVPFTPMKKPLSESRLGVLTTAFFAEGKEPEGLPNFRNKQPYAAPGDPVPNSLYTNDVFWDRDATNMDDLESYLPLKILKSLKEQGTLGSLSKRFYGIPTDYSQRRSLSDATEILKWCREDRVDEMLLVPI